MAARTQKLLAFLVALALAGPAAVTLAEHSAQAGPFDGLKKRRTPARGLHVRGKKKSSDDDDDDDKKKRRRGNSSSSKTKRRTARPDPRTKTPRRTNRPDPRSKSRRRVPTRSSSHNTSKTPRRDTRQDPTPLQRNGGSLDHSSSRDNDHGLGRNGGDLSHGSTKKTPRRQPRPTPHPDPRVDHKTPRRNPRVDHKTPRRDPRVDHKKPQRNPRVDHKTPRRDPRVDHKPMPHIPDHSDKTPRRDPRVDHKQPRRRDRVDKDKQRDWRDHQRDRERDRREKERERARRERERDRQRREKERERDRRQKERDRARRERDRRNRQRHTPVHVPNRRHPGRGHDSGTVVNEHNEYHEHNTYNDNYYGDGGGSYDDGNYREDNYREDNYREDHYHETRYDNRRRHGVGSTSSSTHVRERTEARSSASVVDPYLTLGVGLTELDAAELDNDTMTGADFNLGVGAKGTLFSGELGVHYGGYAPSAATRDISMFGLSGDFRFQPRLGIFEPYALIGVGVHGLSDSAAEMNSVGASLRLGLGADIRLDDYGVSARYLHSAYSFDDPNTTNPDSQFGASNDQFGVNLLIYF